MRELPDGVLSCMIDVLTEKESSSLTEADGFLTVKKNIEVRKMTFLSSTMACEE